MFMFLRMFAAVAAILLTATGSIAQDKQKSKPKPQTLFVNCNIFDGKADKLDNNKRVLVEGNLIKTIGDAAIKAAKGSKVIDCGKRTLMPGLIESHVHLNLQHMVGGYDTIEQRDWQEIGAMAAFTARSLLMDGWTTVRDPGATQAGIRTAIDRGDAIGPRIYTAIGVISQTAGHGDFRLKGQRTLESRYGFKAAQLGMTYIVDGYDATLSAARQNLANGAAFNKMMLSGGVFSSKDPLHTVQGTADEIRAVVEASKAWGTYVTAHIMNASDARRGIEIGLKEVMHVVFLDDETAKFMIKNGTFYNPQLSVSSQDAIEATFGLGESVNKSKALTVADAMAKLSGILLDNPKLLKKTTFGVDTVTNTPANAIRARDHEVWFWTHKFGNFQALKSMTSIGGQLAALTGKNNPYPGKLGVIENGAYADILIVDGNPLEDITVLGGNPKNFDAPDRKAGEIETMRLIMKDGKIYKNTLK
jgi:imidazolonepropionase-like amidohydrolase